MTDPVLQSAISSLPEDACTHVFQSIFDRDAIESMPKRIFKVANVAYLVAKFCGPRCCLCDEGIASVVIDGEGNLQLWCLTCVLGMLPDDTMRNIHAKPGSLSANPPISMCISGDTHGWQDPRNSSQVT